MAPHPNHSSRRRRLAAVFAAALSWKDLTCLMAIGEISGVAAGTIFASRREAYDANVHRQLQAGICGTAAAGAESIVVSGGYVDDEDHGWLIVYTGQGGRDPDSGRQIANQELIAGNAALVTSHLQGSAVRVIRGAHKGSRHAPQRGYRYDGLYVVDSYGSAIGQDGYLVWRFRLVQEERVVVPEATSPQVEPASIKSPVPRISVTTQRIVRSTKVSQKIKDMYRNRCQVCGTSLRVLSGAYSEAAHIQALGTPHNGPDVAGNILCLCPNHHVRLDNGGIYIRDDLVVIDAIDGSEIGSLAVDPDHGIDLRYIQNHRARWRHT